MLYFVMIPLPSSVSHTNIVLFWFANVKKGARFTHSDIVLGSMSDVVVVVVVLVAEVVEMVEAAE